MTLAGSKLSRRGLLAVLALVGTAGCAGRGTSADQSEDRYILAIKGDPMFAWTPTGYATRDVAYSRMITTQPFPDRTSDVIVTYVVSDATRLPGLVQQARTDSVARGYSKDGLRYVGENSGQIAIKLDVGALSDNSGLFLHFQAPAPDGG